MTIYAYFRIMFLPFRKPDTHTLFKKQPFKFSPKRKLHMLPPLSLDTIKKIKNSLVGVTINDVITSALTGSIRRYMLLKQDPALSAKIQLRVLIPFAFPTPDTLLHNNWTMISVPLPIDSPSPIARLSAVQSTISKLKKRPEPFAARSLQRFWETLKLLGI